MRQKTIVTFAFVISSYSAIQLHAQWVDTVAIALEGSFQYPYSFGTISSNAYSCKIDRSGRPFVYVCSRELGLVTFDLADPTTPGPVDTVGPSALGGLDVNNVEQIGDLLYLSLGSFEGTAQTAGLATVDMTDPLNPVVLDVWSDPLFQNGAAISVTHNDLAYLGAMDDGVVVLDVSDPSDIFFLSAFQPDTIWPGIVNYPPQARGMAVRNDVLYLCFDGGAFRTLDIGDPFTITQIGQYVNPMHPILTAIAHNNVILVGDHAIITYDYCGWEVVDISDPSSMVQEAWIDPWNCFGLSWIGSDGHTNELIATSGDSLLFMSGADSEVLVYDISSPTVPVRIGAYGPPNDSAVTWGLDVFGNTIVACYLNNSWIPPPQPFFSNWGGIRVLEWEAILPTSVPGIKRESGLHPYPIPAHDRVTIELPEGSGDVDLQCFDTNGRLITDHQVTVYPQRIVLDVSALRNGAYVLHVRTAQHLHVSPFLVIH